MRELHVGAMIDSDRRRESRCRSELSFHGSEIETHVSSDKLTG
jgi:hypothetical protein